MQYIEPIIEILIMEPTDLVCSSGDKINGFDQGEGGFGSIDEYL